MVRGVSLIAFLFLSVCVWTLIVYFGINTNKHRLKMWELGARAWDRGWNTTRKNGKRE